MKPITAKPMELEDGSWMCGRSGCNLRHFTKETALRCRVGDARKTMQIRLESAKKAVEVAIEVKKGQRQVDIAKKLGIGKERVRQRNFLGKKWGKQHGSLEAAYDVINSRLQALLSGQPLRLPKEKTRGHNIDLLANPSDVFDLSVRASNALRNAEIYSVADLLQETEKDLLRLKNFGNKCLEEIKYLLAEKGLSLGTNPNSLQDENNDQ